MNHNDTMSRCTDKAGLCPESDSAQDSLPIAYSTGKEKHRPTEVLKIEGAERQVSKLHPNMPPMP